MRPSARALPKRGRADLSSCSRSRATAATRRSIEAGGARVVIADGLDHVAGLAAAADIVQFEFWNHPRLFECLARCAFPAMRSVFWSHISGLAKPVIQPGLMEEAGRFVFTTEASLAMPSVAAYGRGRTKAKSPSSIAASVLPTADGGARANGRKPAIAYLGTVDFVKMHPGFFDAIDGLVGDDIRVCGLGRFDPSGPVAARARAMRHPERIKFLRGDSRPCGRAVRRRYLFLSAAARSLRHGGECAGRSDVAGAGAGRPEQSGGNGDRARRRDRLCRALHRGMRLVAANAALVAGTARKNFAQCHRVTSRKPGHRRNPRWIS